jgi:hypothetical protein
MWRPLLVRNVARSAASRKMASVVQCRDWSGDPDAVRREVPHRRSRERIRAAFYRIATGLIMLCTPPLKRGWPSTNRNS